MDVLKRNKKGSHPIELIDDGMLDELLGKLDDILWADHIKHNTPMIPKIHVDKDKPRSEKVKKIPEEKKSSSTSAKKIETTAEKSADDNEDGGDEYYGPYDEGDGDHLGIYKHFKNYLLSQPSTQELPFVCEVWADGEFRIPMAQTKNLDDAFKEFEDCIEKIKITMTEALRLHPNSEMILSRKTSWIATVRKHLKDIANNEEGDVVSEKTPTPVKITGLLTQGNQSPFLPMTSLFCAEVDELISAIQSIRHPGTQSKAEGIQPVNLQSELDNVATTSSIPDTEQEGNALVQYKLRRPKRNTNLPDALRSPYVQRVVSLTDKREQLESALASCILSTTGNKWDVIFECPTGVSILRGSFETIYPEICLDVDIISALAAVLNHEERLRVPGTPARLLVATNFEGTEEYRISMFCSRMEAILGQANSIDIRNFQIVFVPVLYNKHYILVFFNLAQYQIFVINNIEGDVPINIQYSGYVEKVINAFCSYVKNHSPAIAKKLRSTSPVSLKFPWQTLYNGTDCGIFVMRHMETFKGTSVREWNCGLSPERDITGEVLKDQSKELCDLRIKCDNLTSQGLSPTRYLSYSCVFII
ncbi:putative papain-like cysteine peptidase superfamily [Helianthus anomalus]